MGRNVRKCARCSWKKVGAAQRLRPGDPCRAKGGRIVPRCARSWRANAPAAGETNTGEWPHGWQAKPPDDMAIASCLPKRCSACMRARKLEHGSPPSRPRQLPLCRRPCKWHCDDAFDWPCHFAPTGAVPIQVAVAHRIPKDGLAGQTCQGGGARLAVRVASEAVGLQGQVVPQQWLAHPTAPGVRPQDRRRLDPVVYGATTQGARFAAMRPWRPPLSRTGHPQLCSVEVDGGTLQVAERRKKAACPELMSGGPQPLLCWGPRSAGDGAPVPGASSVTCSQRAPPPCGAQRIMVLQIKFFEYVWLKPPPSY